MKRVALAVIVASLSAPACDRGEDDALVLYSGRSEALVRPIVEGFEEETGIPVDVRYGATSELAIALMTEGDSTRADLFWGQDAGALGALDREGLLAELPAQLDGEPAGAFRGRADSWVPTSGRARVFAYSTERVREGELPGSIRELADPAWEGRVGWAPTNASFQAFVTAMIAERGESETKSWLEAMRENGAERYANNSALLAAIGAGEIDSALTNHYYLLRRKDEEPDFPAAQTRFDDGDIGNLVNVAGIARVAGSGRAGDAEAFIEATLADEAQRFFAEETFEYPVTTPRGDDAAAAAARADELEAARPGVDFRAMADLDACLELLRDVELL